MSINYANEASFKAYVEYLALKKHFTTDNYDYHKYNGKVKASFDKFTTRNDAFFFHKLSKRPNWDKILLSNIVKNQSVWIRDVVEETGESIFAAWESRMDSITYAFKEDLKKLNDDYASNFFISDGQHPFVLTLYLQKKISLETFTILAHTAKVYEYWDKEISDKIVAKDIIRLSRKYYPFLEIDQKKFSEIVKNRFFEDK
jgi:hypothetical protein